MPLRKKNSLRNKIIIWTLVIAVIVMMLIYFPPTQNVTEVVLYQ